MDWDTSLFHAINGLVGRSAALDAIMVYVAHQQNLVVPGLVAIGFWVWRRHREALWGIPALALLIALADFLGARIKELVARPRPCHVLENVDTLIGCGGHFSLPSNHALNTAAAAAFFQALYPRSGWISWPIVAVVGISRVYLGAHYVSDVLAGWVIGVTLGGSAAFLLLRWRRFRPAAGSLPVGALRSDSRNGKTGMGPNAPEQD